MKLGNFWVCLLFPVECTEDAQCSNGLSCQSNLCISVCTQDSDCSDTESCENGQCSTISCDSVACGVNAECLIANHAAACQCDTGFLPNPDATQGCARCTQDSDCNAGESCNANLCATTCIQDSNCADNEACDTSSNTCVEVVCPYPMDRSAVRQCGANAICAVANHVATCQCETGFYPNTTPEEGCVECTEVSHCTNGQTCHYKKCSMSCTQDSDCADSESCKTGQCEDVNCDQLSCGSNAQCVIANHAATCQCNSGYHTATTADDGCCKFYYNSQTPIEQYFDSYL